MTGKNPTVAVTQPQGKRWWTRLLKRRFLLISVGVHLIFGVGAAYLVVQQIQANRKLVFYGGPPSPNRSTRALEHQISMAKKQKTMSAPPQAKRIATTGLSKIALPDLPSIATSSSLVSTKMAGMGGAGLGLGLSGGGGGMGAGGGTVQFFGFREKQKGALVGNFYDLKQTRDRKDSKVDKKEYGKIVEKFVEENFRESIFRDYYKAPKPLYATQIMIPDMDANEGPKAFGVEKEVEPSRWVAHYKGKVSPPEDGTYYFVGGGDDIMLVRFNGRLVLDRCWYTHSNWEAKKNYDYDWTKIPKGFARGDAMELKAGEWYEMEVLIGEQPGGRMFAALLVEKEGVNYHKDKKGNPILPMFRLANLKMPPLKSGQSFPPHEDNGPIWSAQNSDSGSSSLLDQKR